MKLGLAIVGILLVGCGAATSPAAATHTLTGTVVLNNNGPVIRQGSDCHGTKGFDDISTALSATIKDDAGKIIATAPFSAEPRGEQTFESGRICTFTFTATVPDSPFYTVSLGRRGDLTYSRAEIEATDWAVELSIGDPE